MKNILILVLLIPNFIFGQETVDFMEYCKFKQFMDSEYIRFNEDSLNIHFMKYINDYRVSKDLEKLSYDKSINVVTKDQTDYCALNSITTHDQTNNNKKTFIDRGKFYNYKKELFGENICSFSGYINFFKEYQKTKNFYDILCKSALNSWKNSEYHNMLLLYQGVKYFSVNMSKNGENFYFCYLVGFD